MVLAADRSAAGRGAWPSDLSQRGYSGSGLGEGEATDEASHPAVAMGMQVSAVGVADAWRCSEGRSEGGLTDWLSTRGFRGLGENPFLAMAGACDGGVRGRRDLPEGVDGMLSFPLRGKLQTRGSVVGGVLTSFPS